MESGRELLESARLFTLRQTKDSLSAFPHPTTSCELLTDPAEALSCLVDYFRLDISLSDLYQEWMKKDGNFKARAAKCTGVRLLRQDPTEALVAFICSSNNNIARISMMLERLCERYGKQLGIYQGASYYSFPSLQALAAKGCEEEMRRMGFGYRAKYVHQAARMVVEECGGEEWLVRMRERAYEEVKEELQRLPGVGSKVADCVCLMGLDKLEAVPVDTHVWKLAQRDYGVKPGTSLTSKAYQEVGDRFRSLFGNHAGWAQAVLFTAELASSKKASVAGTSPQKVKRKRRLADHKGEDKKEKKRKS